MIITFCDCTHYYYMPNMQNVPLFKEKNEVNATLSIGTGDQTSTLEFQGAYSFTNNLAVSTNLMLANGEYNNDKGNGTYIETSLGYFRPLLYDFLIFELFSGVGMGNQEHIYYDYPWGGSPTYMGTSNCNLFKGFIQPAIGITFYPVDFAISGRFSYLNFIKVTNNINKSYPDFCYLDTISKNRTSYLFEPALTIRLGWKYTKLQLQLVNSFNLANADLRFEKFNLNLGLFLTFANRYNNKKTN